MEKNKENKEEDDNRKLYSYAKYTSLIYQMIGIILLSLFIGIKLDSVFSFQKPYLTVGLTVLGLIIALILLFKTLLKK